MHAVIRGSNHHESSEIDNDSPVNDVEEAFERTTLSISRDKIVKGMCFVWGLIPLYLQMSHHVFFSFTFSHI